MYDSDKLRAFLLKNIETANEEYWALAKRTRVPGWPYRNRKMNMDFFRGCTTMANETLKWMKEYESEDKPPVIEGEQPPIPLKGRRSV